MQSISGPLTPTGMNGVSNVGAPAAPSGASTMQAVNNITNALMGATTPTMSAPQIIATTLSGALGNSISSLMKTNADNTTDVSQEDWAQEVLNHQDGTKQLAKDFAATLAKQKPKLGKNGLAIPGFPSQELQGFLDDAEENWPH